MNERRDAAATTSNLADLIARMEALTDALNNLDVDHGIDSGQLRQIRGAAIRLAAAADAA